MKRTLKIVFKVLAGIIISVLLLLILAVVLLRLPAVQNYVTQKAVSFVSSKTNTRVELKRLYIEFPKSIVIENLFAEDQAHDTLLYVSKLSVDINMIGLLDQKVEINKVLLNGVNANIVRSEVDSSFNFKFIIDAFASKEPKAIKHDTDTAASAWQVQVNKVMLNNIRATFNDSIGGTAIKGYIGNLDLDMKSMDIKQLSFTGKDLLLADANVSIIQNKPGTESPDTAIVVMPLLSLNKLELHRVDFLYESKPNGQRIQVHAGNALVNPDKIDLNAHHITVKRVEIDSTAVSIALRRDTIHTNVPTDKPVHTTAYAPWIVGAGKVKLAAVNFKLDFTNLPKQTEGVDYNHLALNDVYIDIDNATYDPDHTVGRINNIALREQSGFVLKQLSADVVYDKNYAELSNLQVITNRTSISHYAKITYTAIEDIGKDVGELGINADLRNTSIAIDDILVFAPMLKDQPVFKGNSGKNILVSGVVKGKLKDLTANNLKVSVLDSTVIDIDGHIVGLPDALNAKYDVTLNSIITTRNDLYQLLGDKLPKQINVPNNIALSGRVNGGMSDAAAVLSLKTSSGNADIDATFRMQPGDTVYTATISTEALNVGYILKNEKLLGPVTMQLQAKGQNFNINNLIAEVNADVKSIMLNKYNYTNIKLEATADKQIFKADLEVDDKNIVLDMAAALSTRKNEEMAKVALDVEGADLKALNLLEEELRTSGKVDIDVFGGMDNLIGKASINEVIVAKGDDMYRVDSLLVASLNDDKHSPLKMNSGVVMIDYDGSIEIPKLVSAVKQHINHYFTIDHAADTANIDTGLQNFTLALRVMPHPILEGVLLPGLKRFNGINAQAEFNNQEGKLDLSVEVPVFEYGALGAEEIDLKISTTEEKLDCKLTATSMQAGPVKLAETTFSANVKDNAVDFALNIFDEDSADKLIVAGDLKQEKPKEYTVHLAEDKLTIANKKWLLPADNYVRFGADGLFVNKIDLTSGSQSLTAQSEQDGNELKVVFKQFELGILSQIIEDDTALVRGVINGNIDLRNMKQTPAFVSDLTISDVYYQQHPVGNIKLSADNLSANKYTAQLSIDGYDNDVKAKGYYLNAGGSNTLDFKVDINKLNMQTIEPFTGGQIRRSKGYVTGDVTVTGTAAKPQINGGLTFKNASFNVAYINNYLTLKDERVSIDPKGVYFNSFDILDSLGQKANLDGAVYTNDLFKTMKFDAVLTTNNFTILNTTIRDNPLFFGKVIVSSNIKVKGDNTLPVVRADLTLLKGSDVAVIIPSSKVSVDRGEGVVVLTDTASTYSIMNAQDTAQLLTAFKGIDLIANVSINKQTTFKLVIDKQSGDSLVVKGEGRLSFSMDESGNQNLTGTYYLNDGGYRATIQKVIKRELRIQPGGSITWNGSPLDATVDITAVYSVETSPVDLIATDMGASSTSELNAYRKPLLFKVLMSMEGKLLKPKIDFSLDMAESDKNAYGGIVYSKIQSLNNDPSELNKQVFALLIMKKFIPSGIGGSDGAGNMASNFARNSVSQILTDQLNSLSGQFIKGVDLNFGIRANDDYTAEGTTENTEFSVGLSKSFFRDRLTIKLGTSINVDNNTGNVSGTDANNLTGDIVLDYKINKEGTLRFKAFRENQYEGIIDGSLYKTGVGFSLTKDYDTVKELFTPLKTKEQRKEEARLDKEQAQKDKAERKAKREARKNGQPVPSNESIEEPTSE